MNDDIKSLLNESIHRTSEAKSILNLLAHTDFDEARGKYIDHGELHSALEGVSHLLSDATDLQEQAEQIVNRKPSEVAS